MSQPKVDVIIVKYNQPDYEATSVLRVAQCTFYENYSLTAYQNKKGVALSKCWNRLIEQSDAEYICLLNSDAMVTPRWLTDLMNVFQSVENVGAVVPSSNTVYLSEIEIPFAVGTANFDLINQFAATNANDGRCVELPTLSAMCVLFPKALWEEIGGFDEDFFLYGEDTEFFYRMAEKTGKMMIWYHGVYVHHYKGQSVAKAVEDGELNLEEVRARADELCRAKMPNFSVSHRGKEADTPEPAERAESTD
jgi:cellulose synthase/poly-beta-1,6-N-acetylglucosamine synthase-like glycosyltransferase